jgi:protein TonB
VAEYVRRNYEYIQRSVKRTLKYPAQAKRARFQGTAQVVFTINRDGTVSGLVLRVSSGAAVLDEAALDAIRRAAPFRPPPAPAKILLPVVFSIN